MASLALPDPPLHDDVIALRGFHSSDAAALVDIGLYFARMRGG